MISLKTIRSRHFYSSLNNVHFNSSSFMHLSSVSRRPFSRSTESAHNADEKIRRLTQPLSGFFRKVIFGEEKTENIRVVTENAELEDKRLNRLRNLEEEVRILNKEKCQTAKKLETFSEKTDSTPTASPKTEKRRLSEFFANGNKGQSKSKLKSNSTSNAVSKPKPKTKAEPKPVSEAKSVDRSVYGMEDPMVHRELSPDMKMLAEHLYVKGYFKKASFMRQDRFDPTLFEVSYARDFLKFAATEFGEDHLDIAGWLSAGDLKTIALFGCPTLGQRTVNAAKHLRGFFKIDEHKVCQACALKDTCKNSNKSFKDKTKKLYLGSVMKVLIMYAMESVPQKLVVSEEVKNSVSRLLKEIVSLSQVKS